MNQLRFVLLFVCLMAGLSVKADRGGFYYRNFHVEAVVHPDNVWDVTETMDVMFTEPRHGIYRYIPTTYWLEHDVSMDEGMKQRVNQGQVVQDWRKFDYKSEVDDVRVEGLPFTTTDSDDEFCVIRIGDADREVTGEQRYVIHYTYTYREDRRPNYDYLFHTILGTDFNESIGHFDFKITFEKPLPSDIQKRLEVYSGEYGSEEGKVKDLTIKASRTAIIGSADNVSPHHGITLYAQLPEGYYEDVLKANPMMHYVFFALTVLCIVVITLYLFKAKRKNVLRVMEYFPPEGISSAEVGTIIDDSVDDVDLASLIPWLAGEGYLRVSETVSSKGLFGKTTDLELTKLKDLPKSAPAYQRKMMNLFFSRGNVVKMADIGERPDAILGIKKALADYFKGKRQLTRMQWQALLYIPLLLLSTATFATNSVVETLHGTDVLLAIMVWAIPFFLGVGLRFVMSVRDIFASKWKRLLIFCVKALLMLALCWIYCEYVADYGAPMPKAVAAGLFVICFLLGEFIGRFNVDTDYRVQLANRLLGFKEFIKTADKPHLEEMQEADPQYFYKVLPYAMVFGLSSKWAKLFKDINVEKPEWYDTTVPLTGSAFTKHMASNFYSSASQAITTISHDSSSHGSASSGGSTGFSGGGGGGGGGGSW